MGVCMYTENLVFIITNKITYLGVLQNSHMWGRLFDTLYFNGFLFRILNIHQASPCFLPFFSILYSSRYLLILLVNSCKISKCSEKISLQMFFFASLARSQKYHVFLFLEYNKKSF